MIIRGRCPLSPAKGSIDALKTHSMQLIKKTLLCGNVSEFKEYEFGQDGLFS